MTHIIKTTHSRKNSILHTAQRKRNLAPVQERMSRRITDRMSPIYLYFSTKHPLLHDEVWWKKQSFDREFNSLPSTTNQKASTNSKANANKKYLNRLITFRTYLGKKGEDVVRRIDWILHTRPIHISHLHTYSHRQPSTRAQQQIISNSRPPFERAIVQKNLSRLLLFLTWSFVCRMNLKYLLWKSTDGALYQWSTQEWW